MTYDEMIETIANYFGKTIADIHVEEINIYDTNICEMCIRGYVRNHQNTAMNTHFSFSGFKNMEVLKEMTKKV